jgi:hypothetical protein
MKREKYFIIFLLLFSQFSAPHLAQAKDCIDKACIDVYVQDGKLIIEGRKGSGPKNSTLVPPVITKKPVVPKPVITKKPLAPKPVISSRPIEPKPVITKKPVVPKPVVTKKPEAREQAATSLSDRLSKSIPTGGISYQPNFSPLVRVPVYFWCDLPAAYRTEVKIIGETIDVLLRPSFTWSFGDGSFTSTTQAGAPYPEGEISHAYSNPGTYLVTLITTWNGTFTHNATERAVTGNIRKTSIATIKIVPAPSRFMN